MAFQGFFFAVWNGLELRKHYFHLENYDHNRDFGIKDMGYELFSLTVELYMISGLKESILEALSVKSISTVGIASLETLIFIQLFVGIIEVYRNLGEENQAMLHNVAINILSNPVTPLNTAYIDSPLVMPKTGTSQPALKPKELRHSLITAHTFFKRLKGNSLHH